MAKYLIKFFILSILAFKKQLFMNIDSIKRKPSVIIDLEPYLQDYLYHEFGQPRNHDGVVVSGTHDIGRMIQALVTVTDKPRKQELGEHPITLYLPIQSWNHALFEENFIYIPEWKQKQLKMYIESCFRIKVREYFLIGHQKGYRQDQIIRAFLEAYNIKFNALSYDQLKQYDYRNRRKIIREISEDIRRSTFD